MKYSTLRSLVRFFMRIIADIEVRGIDNQPQGNFIIASNHLGRLDTAVLICVIDRDDIIMAIAEKYKSHPIFGPIGRSVNGIWLNRFEVDYAALRQILARMEQGGMLAIAPEGTRSKTEALQEGKMGVALLLASGAVLAQDVKKEKIGSLEPKRESKAPPAPPKEVLDDPSALKERAPEVFKVRFETRKGNFVVEAHRAWSPNGVDRFYTLVKNGYYDGVKFFRVVPNFRPVRHPRRPEDRDEVAAVEHPGRPGRRGEQEGLSHLREVGGAEQPLRAALH